MATTERNVENILIKVAEYIKSEGESITGRLLEQAVQQLDLQLSSQHTVKHKQLLFILLKNVSESLVKTKLDAEKIELEYDIDNFFYHDGTLLKDTIEIISTFRLCLLNEIQNKNLLDDVSSQEISIFYEQVIFIFDDAIRNTTKNFNLQNQKVLEAIEKEILELAAPIVPIKCGVAVLPLIGDFSESRATYITNEVIPKISQLNLEMLVIDFSRIHNFDTHVAQQVFQIRDILNSLGIQPIVTGIRPFIAQTAVNLGINVKDLQTYSTVKQFLEVLENKERLIN